MVKQRSYPEQKLPPADYGVCDTTVQLPCLLVKLEPLPPSRDKLPQCWRRCIISFWGLWSDRLGELVRLGDVLSIQKARDDADAAPPGLAYRLMMLPVGGDANASVLVSSGSKVSEVRVSGILNICSLQFTPQLVVKRSCQALASYTYRTVRTMPEPGGSEKAFHIFGVVIGYQLPQPTRGPDFKSVLYLVDESSEGSDDHLAVNFFKAHPELPGVGSVIRLHRIEPKAPWNGVRQAQSVSCRGGKSITHWVVGDAALAAGQDAHVVGEHFADASWNSGTFTWSEKDSARVRQLEEWSRTELSRAGGPLSAFHCKTPSLTEANAGVRQQLSHGWLHAPAPQPANFRELDLLVQLGPPLAEAAVAAACPSVHGSGGSGTLLAMAELHDAGGRAYVVAGGALKAGLPASGALQVRARLYLAHTVPVMLAQVLLRTLTLRCAEATNASAAEDFSEGWVRLRNVRLHWSSASEGAPWRKVIFDSKSMAMRIPNHHAQVQPLRSGCRGIRDSGPTMSSMPAPSPQSSAPVTATTNRQGLSLLPPGARGEERPGATRMRRGITRLVKYAHTVNELPGDAEVVTLLSAHQPHGGALMPVSGLHTRTLLLPFASPAISIREVHDRYADAPCVHRVRASVLQIFPCDEREWTVKAPHMSLYSYAMVMTLADIREQTMLATLSATLLGREGERFFSALGLPATNLQRGNVTLAVLRAQINALCASAPIELCLLAYRPSPEDTSCTGVAYQVVGTMCFQAKACNTSVLHQETKNESALCFKSCKIKMKGFCDNNN